MRKILLFILGAVIGITCLVFVVHSFFNVRITAVFEELEPFPRNLNVYYKGFKLGRSVRVRPSKDFTNTQVDIILNAKGINLPDNITAKVKRRDKKDYIELEYPDSPSITDLKNHSVIQGKKSFDISSYIDKQVDGGGLDEIKDNLNVTVESAGETLRAVTELVNTGNDILKDLRPSLKKAGENLAAASKNLAEVTGELNKSAKPTLGNTFENIELTTRNLERSTRNFETASVNINGLTGRANQETITLVNCLVQNATTVVRNINAIVLNVNDIMKGFKSTLSKRFGGMRVILGKPLD